MVLLAFSINNLETSVLAESWMGFAILITIIPLYFQDTFEYEALYAPVS